MSHSWRRACSVPLVVLTAGTAACAHAGPNQEVAATVVPMEVRIDVERRDTLFDVRGTGYAATAPVRAVAATAKARLDGAAREWRRYFDLDPAFVVVKIDTVSFSVTEGGRPLEGHDRVELRDAVRVVHTAVAVQSSNEKRSRERGAGGAPRGATMTPYVQTVARLWLGAYADELAELDSVRPAAEASAGTSLLAKPGLPNDARIPDWVETGLVTLLVQNEASDMLPALLAGQTLIPLETLLSMSQPDGMPSAGFVLPGPPSGQGPPGGERGMPGGGRGGMPGGGRGGMGPPGSGGMGPPRGEGRRPDGQPARKLDQPTLFVVQSAAFAHFIADRGGPVFLGRLVDSLIVGKRVTDVLGQSRRLGADYATLEREWANWLRAFAPEERSRGGGMRRP